MDLTRKRFLNRGFRKKIKNFKGGYISHVPEISKFDLNENSLGFVLGTDGLWDELNDQQVLQYYGKFKGDKYLRSLLIACLKNAAFTNKMTLKKLQKIKGQGKRSYHDDITLVYVDLANQYKKPE